jgi:hypothetical protein
MIRTQNLISWEKLKNRDRMEHRVAYGRITHVKEIWRRSWIPCIWVRIKTSGRLL